MSRVGNIVSGLLRDHLIVSHFGRKHLLLFSYYKLKAPDIHQRLFKECSVSEHCADQIHLSMPTEQTTEHQGVPEYLSRAVMRAGMWLTAW